MKYKRGKHPNSQKNLKRGGSDGSHPNSRKNLTYRIKKGSIGFFSGRNHTDGTRLKMSTSRGGNEITRTKEYRNWQKNKRNRMKRTNGGYHIFTEWETLKAQYNWTCPACRKSEPIIQLTEDHIIPVSKGGSDNIENIQPLCRGCNSKKMIKIIKY